ncbi:MAG: hypothetical protein S4CHLAM37_12940 [Chlamydiia bacterium]|nr:hypothetical protein [Chlamydiia bacterium]
MASYLGNLLSKARDYVYTYTDTSPAVTTARDTAHTLGQLSSYVYKGGSVDTLFHDAKEPIADIIEIIKQLADSEKVFESGDQEEDLPHDWEQATLNDYIKLIEELPGKRSRELFNTANLKTTEHYESFKGLVDALKAEIKAHEQILEIDENAELKLTGQTRAAAQTLIGTLNTLKTANAGLLTTTRHSAKAHSELYTLAENLSALQENLMIKDDQTIIGAAKDLTDTYNRILKRQTEVLQGKTLSARETLKISKLLIALQAFKELPEALRSDDRFNPSYESIIADLGKTAEIFAPYISKQEGALTKSMNLVVTKARSYAEDNVPFLRKTKEAPQKDATTPFHVLEAAIDSYLFKMQGRASVDKLLDELLNDCESVREGFKEAFLDEIAMTKPGRRKSAALDHEYAKTHALDSKEVLKEAFTEALENTQDVESEDDLPAEDILANLKEKSTLVNRKAAEAKAASEQNKDGNILVKYANDAFSYITAFKASIPAAALSVFGKTFLGFLENKVLENTIQSQSDAERKVLREIFDKTKVELLKAMESTKVEDYLKAFGTFKEYYSKQQFVLDALVIPPLFDTEVEEVESPHEALKTLRKDFQRTTQKETEHTDWEVKLQAKSKEFVDNIRDYTVFNAVYGSMFSKKGEDINEIFAKISEEISIHKNETTRRRAFIREVRKAISKSDAGFVKKFIMRRALPIIHSVMSFYVKQGANEGLQYIDELIENLNEKDSNAKIKVVRNFSHGSSMYAKMLSDWATVDKGDKQEVIEGKLKEAKYNDGYTQKRLYDNFASKAVDRFITGANIANFATLSFSAIKSWIIRPTLTPSNTINRGLNIVSSGVKSVIGGTAVVASSVFYAIGIVGEKILNAAVRNVIKQFIYRNKAVDQAVMTTRNSIYENNPYVQTITKFIVSQLDTLSKTLDGVIESESSTSAMEQVAVSPPVKEQLTCAIKNYFKALQLDSFSIDDEAQEYISNRGTAAQIMSKFDSALLPSVIDSIVNVCVLGSRTLLEKNSLNENLYNLFDQLNQSLVHHEKKKTDAEAAKEHREYAEQHAKLNRHMDKIMKQLIEIAVNDTIDNFGNKQVREAEELKGWIENSLKGPVDDSPGELIAEIVKELEDFTPSATDSLAQVNEDLERITKLKEKASEFLGEMQARILTFEDNSNDRTIREFHKQLNPIVKSLQEALDNKHLLLVFNSQRLLSETMHDLPFIEHLESRFAATTKLVEEATQDPSHTDDVHRLDANYTLITSLIDRLNIHNPNNDEPIKLKRGGYGDLEKEIFYNATFYDNWKDSTVEFKNALRNIQTLNSLAADDTFKKMKELRIQMIDEAPSRSRFRMSSTTGKNMLKEFADLKGKMTFEFMPAAERKFAALLDELAYETHSEEEVNEKIQEIQETIQSTKARQQTELARLKDTIVAANTKAHDLLKTSSTSLKENQKKAIEEGTKSVKDTLDKTEDLADTSSELESINFVRVNLGIVDRLKGVTTKAIYQAMKPKVSLSLILKGTYAQYLAQHMVLKPFIK